MFGIKTKIGNIIYRKKNKHNFTKLKHYTKISDIKVGKGTYGILDIKKYGGENSKLYIGNYCSIANDCVFLLGGEHNYKKISTYPFKAYYLNEGESTNNGDIIIDDDVWIGYGSTILSGVRIGQGAIIGAKSVVAKDIPPYAVYVGNRIIKYRFNENIIEKLLKANYDNLSKDKILKNIEKLYENINENNVEEIINIINKK